MSSFIDNLRRENKFQEKLQYDDGAFYYFFSALTVLIVVPLTFSVIYNYFKKAPFELSKENVPKIGGKNISHLLVQKKKQGRINKNLIYKVFVAAFLVFLYAKMVSKSDATEIKGFDPYEILEVDRHNFDLDAAKKNFRKLSLKYHPDRNPDDPNAAMKFQLLTKAMDCLSDEKNRENCEKFGNPDGTGGFSVGIALPTFLLEKENRVPVLVIFFVFILVIIPYFVLSWYSEVSKYDMDGVLLEDRQIFAIHLNENFLNKQTPLALAMCFEFNNILSVSSAQARDLVAIHKEIQERTNKPKLDQKYFKPYDLIHAYMFGLNIGDSLLPDLLTLLQTSPRLIESLVKFSFLPAITLDRQMKPLGLRCCMNVIDFGQHFYQAMWPGDSPLLQIAGIDRDMVETLTKKKKKLPDFNKIVSAENKAEALGFLPEELIESAAKDIKEFPNMEIKHEVFVTEDTKKNENNQPEVRVGELATLKVTLKRLNYQKSQNSDFTYIKSNSLPFNEKERWYILVANDKNNIIFADVANFGTETYEKTFQFPLQEPGERIFKIHVRPNCYVKLDFEDEIKFTVLQPEKSRKYVISEDDKNALNEPSLFDLMARGIVNRDDGSDEELEEGVEIEKNEEEEEITTKKDSSSPGKKEKSE